MKSGLVGSALVCFCILLAVGLSTESFFAGGRYDVISDFRQKATNYSRVYLLGQVTNISDVRLHYQRRNVYVPQYQIRSELFVYNDSPGTNISSVVVLDKSRSSFVRLLRGGFRQNFITVNVTSARGTSMDLEFFVYGQRRRY